MDFDPSLLILKEEENFYHSPNIIDGIDYLNKLRYNYHKAIPTHNSYEDIYIKNDLIIDLKSGKSKMQNNEYLRSWSKLTTAQKCKIINTFIDDLIIEECKCKNVGDGDRESNKLRRDLRFLLLNGLADQIIVKNTDVEYDQTIGKLIKIYKLSKNEKGYYLSN